MHELANFIDSLHDLHKILVKAGDTQMGNKNFHTRTVTTTTVFQHNGYEYTVKTFDNGTSEVAAFLVPVNIPIPVTRRH